MLNNRAESSPHNLDSQEPLQVEGGVDRLPKLLAGSGKPCAYMAAALHPLPLGQPLHHRRDSALQCAALLLERHLQGDTSMSDTCTVSDYVATPYGQCNTNNQTRYHLHMAPVALQHKQDNMQLVQAPAPPTGLLRLLCCTMVRSLDATASTQSGSACKQHRAAHGAEDFNHMQDKVERQPCSQNS
jgi:hypothetical protein